MEIINKEILEQELLKQETTPFECGLSNCPRQTDTCAPRIPGCSGLN